MATYLPGKKIYMQKNNNKKKTTPSANPLSIVMTSISVFQVIFILKDIKSKLF